MRLQPGINGTIDFVVENGHAQGSFGAGRNIGIVTGVCEASLHDQYDERYASTAFLSPNTWVSGLFGDGCRAKPERVALFSATGSTEVQAAIAQSAVVLRDSRLAESTADATAMALFSYHWARDEACMPHSCQLRERTLDYERLRRPFAVCTLWSRCPQWFSN